MFFVKVFLVVATVCCTTQAYQLSNIPIIGGVLGTVTNASQTVVNTALDAIEMTAEKIPSFDFEVIIKKQIQQILEDLKGMMIDKIPLLGLPRLEPYEHGHQDINITHEIGTFEGVMEHVVVTGLSKFHVDNVIVKKLSNEPTLSFFKPNITIDLHYDSLDISGYYDLNAFIGEFLKVYGKGNYDLTMRGLKINANVVLVIEMMKQQIRIDDIDVDVKLENMTCNFENLMGGGDNGDLFNKVIGQVAPEAVESLWPEIRPQVEEKVKEIMVIHLIPSKIRRFLDLFHINLKPIKRIFGIETK